jgi:hypothetical protein
MTPTTVPSLSEVVRLQATLQMKLRGRVHNLRVEMGSEGLVLLGHAQSYYVKQLAQSCVMDGAGLELAANEITVGGNPAQRMGC